MVRLEKEYTTVNIYLRRGRAALITFVLEGTLIAAILYLVAMISSPVSVRASLPMSLGIGFTSLAAFLLMLTREFRRIPGFRFRHETLVTMGLIFAIALAGAALARWGYGRRGVVYAAVLLQSSAAIAFGVLSWRWIAARNHVAGFYREKIAILGSGEMARQITDYIESYLAADYRIVGFVAESDDDEIRQLGNHRRLATVDTIDAIDKSQVDRVIVALEERRGLLPSGSLIPLRLSGVRFEEITPFVERTSGKIQVDLLLPSLIVFSDGFKVSRLRVISKRIHDFLLSGFLLTVTLPVMLLTALLIKLDSEGPVFYMQERVGKAGRVFPIYKFRSMVKDAETRSGPQWASKADARVTRIGAFIRKTRIDELPQIINIFKGDMSFVGPRPERPVFVAELEQEIPYYQLRSSVRPGLTGWAQVSYPYGASIDDAKQKLKYDLFYLKHASPILDLWIVLKTVKVVLLGSGAR